MDAGAKFFFETLEPRVLLSAVYTYGDVDGDFVTVKTSKGTDVDLAGVVTLATTGQGLQLEKLDFSAMPTIFAGTDVSITAKRTSVGGDGFANVGYIDATDANGGAAIDLGQVQIRGDLGAIDAGDATNNSNACKGLSVQSMGRFGTSTGAPDLESDFNGKLDKLSVKTDIDEAYILVVDSAGSNGKIGSIKIGGSVIGGAADNSGSVVARDALGNVSVGGDIIGAGGATSGAIACTNSVGNVTVGGSILGGAGFTSGVIFASQSSMGSVKVSGDVKGGSATFTGRVFASTSLGDVTVGGDLIGGSLNDSGRIYSDGSVGKVKVGGDVIGGGARSGQIFAQTTLDGATVGGSLVGGPGEESGEIRGIQSIDQVKIGGDVQGGSGQFTGQILSGKLPSVTVGGSVIGSDGVNSGNITGYGSIGSVKIAGDLRGGNGAGDHAGNVFTFGGFNQVSIGGSLIGGTAFSSGLILSQTPSNSLSIGHDIIGGNATGSANVYASGYIQVGSLKNITVGGSIRAGVDTSTGTITSSASIRATDNLGSVDIKGSIVGNTIGDFSPVVISAHGEAALPSNAKADKAIKSIKVGGSVEWLQLIAGVNENLVASNGDAQIGSVDIGGDWIASRASAGTGAGIDGIYGTMDDTFLGGGNASIVGTIGDIDIGGQAIGTVAAGDNFAFIAEKIGSLKIGGASVPLINGGIDNLLIGTTQDVRVIDLG